jgi:hypothetical protein
MKGGRQPMKLPLYQVDAFTSRMFGGNLSAWRDNRHDNNSLSHGMNVGKAGVKYIWNF